MQANIAEQVTTALNVALLGPEREALRDAPTSDPAAHEAYLLGRFHWNKRTRDGLARAAEHFTTAADADSTFAGAWAGLADSYVLWPLYGVTTIPRAEAYARAKAAARRAIALDSVLAEAHASLGLAVMYGDWDWDGAERAFRRAIALDPEYPVAHYWYSELRGVTGRFGDAVAEAERGAALAPAAPIAQHLLGMWLIMAGEWERGLEHERRAIALEPAFTFAHNYLGWYNLVHGRYEEAAAAYANGTVAMPVVEAVIATRRDPTLRQASLARIADHPRARPPSDPGWGAAAYALIQEADSVQVWLERAYTERSELLPLLVPDPLLDFMRGDERLTDIIRRMSLEPYTGLPAARKAGMN